MPDFAFSLDKQLQDLGLRPGDSQASPRMLSMSSARTATGLYGACLI